MSAYDVSDRPVTRRRLHRPDAVHRAPGLTLSSGTAFHAELLADFHFLANPQRKVEGSNGAGTEHPIQRRVALPPAFYAGSPAYNVATVSGGQHNPVVSGGFVIRFR